MFHNPGKEGNVSETVMNCQLMYLIRFVIERERNIDRKEPLYSVLR